MAGVQVGFRGEKEKWGNECSVNGGDGERFLYKLSLTFS